MLSDAADFISAVVFYYVIVFSLYPLQAIIRDTFTNAAAICAYLFFFG